MRLVSNYLIFVLFFVVVCFFEYIWKFQSLSWCKYCREDNGWDSGKFSNKNRRKILILVISPKFWFRCTNSSKNRKVKKKKPSKTKETHLDVWNCLNYLNVFLCIYTDTHIYKLSRTHSPARTHIQTFTHPLIHSHIHKSHALTHAHAYKHAPTPQKHTHTQTLTLTHAHAHTKKHSHTY